MNPTPWSVPSSGSTIDEVDLGCPNKTSFVGFLTNHVFL
jgi:hypothetical protein